MMGATCGPAEPIQWSELEEWEARKARSGAVARMVYYAEGMCPRKDIRLSGGYGAPVVIAAVLPDGTAAKGGIKPGDRLVSIDGSKDLLHLPCEEIHCRLRSPTLLVVAGFVGSLAAEVRICNTSKSTEVAYRSCPTNDSAENDIVLAEETTFSADVASLFLAISGGSQRPAQQPSAQMLELHRNDAHSLKATALKWSELLSTGSGEDVKAGAPPKEAIAAEALNSSRGRTHAYSQMGRRRLSTPALSEGPEGQGSPLQSPEQLVPGEHLSVNAENAPARPGRMTSCLGGLKTVDPGGSGEDGRPHATRHDGDSAPPPTLQPIFGSLIFQSESTAWSFHVKPKAGDVAQEDTSDDVHSDSLGSTTEHSGGWI